MKSIPFNGRSVKPLFLGWIGTKSACRYSILFYSSGEWNSELRRENRIEMSRESGTVERVVTFLTHLAATSGPIQVSKVSVALNLPQSTVHRLIGQFIKLGLLRRMPGSRHYELGTEAFRLGASLSQRVNVVDLAMPSLHRIVQASRESCALALYRETDATLFFAAQVQSPEPIRFFVELFKPDNVLWGTSGRCILAYLPSELPKTLLQGDPISPTGRRPPKLKTLEEQLALVRERGYSTSRRGERVANASGIAVPVFGSPGRILGCLALTAPSGRYAKLNEVRLAALMKAEAAKLSADLSSMVSSHGISLSSLSASR